MGAKSADVLEAAADAATKNGWFATEQFANIDNVEAHRVWTGQEILSQVDGGRVDAVVSGVGTGGTLRGLWEAFTGAGCDCLPFAAIPQQGDAFADEECCSIRFSSEVPGVADGISELYADWKDEAAGNGLREIAVPDCDAISLTQQLWKKGFPVGPSSGLNYGAALQVAEQMPSGSVIVTVFPDRMERYFSHRVFEECRKPGTNS